MESAESMWLAGWRCPNCGNVLDPVMERNRRGQELAAVVSSARAPGHNRIEAPEEVDVTTGLAA